MFMWKTLNRKNHKSPQTPAITMWHEYKREHRGNDLILTFFSWRYLQQTLALYISLSLFLYNSYNLQKIYSENDNYISNMFSL